MEPDLNRLRVLLVDDEPLARARLRSLLADCLAPAAHVVGEAGQATAVWAALAEQRPDLLLLDVQMPGLDGLQLAQRLRAAGQRVALVFVTAHAEHALAAFDVEAVDYLTKPVRRARLQEALARAAAWLGHGPATQPAALDSPQPLGEEPVIVVHQRGEVLRVPLREVLYLKADQKYVQLRTATATHWLDDSLAELSERLGERFLRIHRNALVARGAVRQLARHRVDGSGPGDDGEAADLWSVRVAPVDEWLTVSRRQLAQVRELLRESGGD
jgi:two-component system response regulator AlgR